MHYRHEGCSPYTMPAVASFIYTGFEKTRVPFDWHAIRRRRRHRWFRRRAASILLFLFLLLIGIPHFVSGLIGADLAVHHSCNIYILLLFCPISTCTLYASFCDLSSLIRLGLRHMNFVGLLNTQGLFQGSCSFFL